MAIDVQTRGATMVLTINRPQAMNALDPDANHELTIAWDRFARDDALRVAVITGAGDTAFCAGADLKKSIPARSAAAREGLSVPWAFGGGLPCGRDAGKPVIAAINGHCLAGGLELALACDFRICSPQATFGLAEVKWGIIPGGGGTQRLPRCVPLGMALEMILTGDSVDADTAWRIGLVNRIVPRAVLLNAACELAERVASRGPLAVKAARRAVYGGLGQGFDTGMALEEHLAQQVMRSEDAVEGPLAFAQKRRPVFKGR
ncbi:enoyl-CoA hydratase-related protein [Pseudorhodoferax sp. LjRoot39]|uniref:enoyl-CoA hydratase/isomerase family protein n=1 Tax=Pseudorhodoferax sp. LjRoot39 TaxID=3342328 RepID=UPI003ECC58B3